MTQFTRRARAGGGGEGGEFRLSDDLSGLCLVVYFEGRGGGGEKGKKGGRRFVSPSAGKQSGKLLLFLLFNSRSCFEGAESGKRGKNGGMD